MCIYVYLSCSIGSIFVHEDPHGEQCLGLTWLCSNQRCPELAGQIRPLAVSSSSAHKNPNVMLVQGRSKACRHVFSHMWGCFANSRLQCPLNIAVRIITAIYMQLWHGHTRILKGSYSSLKALWARPAMSTTQNSSQSSELFRPRLALQVPSWSQNTQRTDTVIRCSGFSVGGIGYMVLGMYLEPVGPSKASTTKQTVSLSVTTADAKNPARPRI